MRSKMVPVVILCVVWMVFDPALAEENYQQWSEQTYIDEPFSFYCNDTLYPVFINQDDTLVWRRHGHDMALEDGDLFKLGQLSGIQNMKLTIKLVTDEMSGIYFCEIYAPSGAFMARIVKGLNLGGHKYHDYLDKYRSQIITGAITAASVLFIVLGVCAIDHFRYVSEEERLERQAAKEMHRHKGERSNGVYDNKAMSMEPSAGDPYDNFNDKFQTEINTQL